MALSLPAPSGGELARCHALKPVHASPSLASVITCVPNEVGDVDSTDASLSPASAATTTTEEGDFDLTDVYQTVSLVDLEAPQPDSCEPQVHESAAPEEPALVVLDWDDTLLATTELFHRRRLCSSAEDLDAELQQELQPWREALGRFLEEATAQAHCVVVTNSRDRWVERTVRRFAPELQPLFAQGRVSVVYAHEALLRARVPKSLRGTCLEGLATWWFSSSVDEELLDSEERRSLRTEGKLEAMRAERRRLSAGRIVSLGDAEHEREALLQLSPGCATAKSVQLPADPSLDELVQRLDSLRGLLPELLRGQGLQDLELHRDATITLHTTRSSCGDCSGMRLSNGEAADR